MKNVLIVLVLLCQVFYGQDKLFYTDGRVSKGMLVSISRDFVFFKLTDTSLAQRIPKDGLLLVEDATGVRHVFGQGRVNYFDKDTAPVIPPKNILSLQPIGILFGRATLVYERLNRKGTIGLVIPLSLTFDPFGTIYKNARDTTRNGFKRIKGLNFIGGLDLNFYLGKEDYFKFFVGPRFRYGTDIFLGGLEAYSLQTQFGWKISYPSSRFVQHFSVGFGFVRVLSVYSFRLTNSQQSYGWYSLNYRIGINW